jgi:hypothetical protein
MYCPEIQPTTQTSDEVSLAPTEISVYKYIIFIVSVLQEKTG